MLGLEREYRDKTAGFRTISLITVGATPFAMYSLRLGEAAEDPVRIAAAIIIAGGAVLTVLWIFPLVELRADRARETLTYKITAQMGESTRQSIRAALTGKGLLLFDAKFGKADDKQVLRWKIAVAHDTHEAFAAELMQVPDVIEFDY